MKTRTKLGAQRSRILAHKDCKKAHCQLLGKLFYIRGAKMSQNRQQQDTMQPQPPAPSQAGQGHVDTSRLWQ